jgi:hypothetical protein
MQGTQQDTGPNRPIAKHGRRKPCQAITIALMELRLLELPANSLRRRVIEQMIARALANPH